LSLHRVDSLPKPRIETGKDVSSIIGAETPILPSNLLSFRLFFVFLFTILRAETVLLSPYLLVRVLVGGHVKFCFSLLDWQEGFRLELLC
jgi:hypothetical protein